jgi:hypothetical protein
MEQKSEIIYDYSFYLDAQKYPWIFVILENINSFFKMFKVT